MKLKALFLTVGLCCSAALSAQNLLVNPGFEDAEPDGAATGWKNVTPFYSVSGEFARNGKKSLYFKNTDKNIYKVCTQNITALLKKNSNYRFGVYVRTRGMQGYGPTVCVEFWGENNTYISGSYPIGSISTNSDWAFVEGFFNGVPEKAVRASLAVYCREKSTGEAWFDDVFLEAFNPPMLKNPTTDAYKDIIDGHRDLKLYVMAGDGKTVFAKDLLPGMTLKVVDQEGKTVFSGKPTQFDATGAVCTMPSRTLTPGSYTYRFESVLNGEPYSAEGTFMRVAELPKRKAYIDDHRRLIVDGKPFFPLGLYFHGISADYEKFKGSPFNCIMPYYEISRKDLDRLHKDGISVIYSVKDFYPGSRNIKTFAEAEQLTTQTIERLKDHPAIIAWYANDEMPASMIKQLTAKKELVERLDPEHPIWICLYQYKEIRDYLPSFDVIGHDVYPVKGMPEDTIGRVLKQGKMTTDGAFGVRAHWMIPQVMNWSVYWTTYGRSVEEILKCRAPSFEEMKAMTWMSIAGGATGLVYYSWFDLVRMGKERKYRNATLPADDFEKRWAEVKKMAAEVKAHEDVLLAIDPALELKADAMPADIGMRVFGKGDETWVLLVNSLSDKTLTGSFTAPCDVVCRGVTLSETQPVINGKNVQIALKPLEAVFVRLARK